MSWIDRLITWATTRKTPWWALAAFWMLLELLAVSAVKWWDGSLSVGEIYPRAVDLPYAAFGAVGYGLMVARARDSFDDFRPALAAEPAEAAEMRKAMTSLTPKMLGAASGLVLVVFTAAWATDPQTRELAGSSLQATIVIVGIAYLINGLFVGAFLALLGRQLIWVGRLHRRVDRVDLLRSGPAQSFARLTSAGGVIVLFVTLYSALTDPNTFENPVWFGFSVGSGLFAVIVFFVPLRGMRRRLQAEKRRLLDESGERLLRATARLHGAIDRGGGEVSELRVALQSLDEDRARIKAASTLPWETATLRGFGTALALPLLTWLITALATRAFGF